jgi:hypothetical protein
MVNERHMAIDVLFNTAMRNPSYRTFHRGVIGILTPVLVEEELFPFPCKLILA